MLLFDDKVMVHDELDGWRVCVPPSPHPRRACLRTHAEASASNVLPSVYYRIIFSYTRDAATQSLSCVAFSLSRFTLHACPVPRSCVASNPRPANFQRKSAHKQEHTSRPTRTRTHAHAHAPSVVWLQEWGRCDSWGKRRFLTGCGAVSSWTSPMARTTGR
jgi:hypothetical protein